MLDACAHHVGGHGQVINSAAGNTELLVDGFEPCLELAIGSGVIEAAVDVKERASKVSPMAVFGRPAGETHGAVLGTLPDPLIRIAFGPDAKSNHGEIRRQHAVHVQ